jgi:hypothetical protein
MKMVAIVVAACALLSGCTAPLGFTTYPRAAMNDVQGTWEATVGPEGDGGDTGQQARMILDVRRMGAAPGVVVEDDAAARDDVNATANAAHLYVVTVRFEELDAGRTPAAPARDDPAKTMAELGPIELEGEFIQTRRWTLFTFQRSFKHWDWTGLSTPVQRTVRVRMAPGEGGAPDQLIVDEPKAELVYVPIAMAGELRFRAPEGGAESTSLVQNLDDAFATLDKMSTDEWKPWCVFTRTGK